jgi:hypothetical protein
MVTVTVYALCACYAWWIHFPFYAATVTVTVTDAWWIYFAQSGHKINIP